MRIVVFIPRADDVKKSVCTDKYHIMDMLGEGSFAKVYRGVSIDTNQIVAIKGSFFSFQIQDPIFRPKPISADLDLLPCLQKYKSTPSSTTKTRWLSSRGRLISSVGSITFVALLPSSSCFLGHLRC
jgi:serine/threonine protein kinase